MSLPSVNVECTVSEFAICERRVNIAGCSTGVQRGEVHGVGGGSAEGGDDLVGAVPRGLHHGGQDPAPQAAVLLHLCLTAGEFVSNKCNKLKSRVG